MRSQNSRQPARAESLMLQTGCYPYEPPWRRRSGQGAGSGKVVRQARCHQRVAHPRQSLRLLRWGNNAPLRNKVVPLHHRRCNQAPPQRGDLQSARHLLRMKAAISAVVISAFSQSVLTAHLRDFSHLQSNEQPRICYMLTIVLRSSCKFCSYCRSVPALCSNSTQAQGCHKASNVCAQNYARSSTNASTPKVRPSPLSHELVCHCQFWNCVRLSTFRST